MPDKIELYERKQLYTCPRCGRDALNQISNTHFRCLWCRFDRNTDEDDWNVLQMLLAIVGTIFMIAML